MATQVKKGQIDDTIVEYGMARQAVINGNFDIWQRGTSVTPADGAVTFQADHWADAISRDGGTLPTLTRSRQSLTVGAIPNSFYFTRLATNGAGTSLGVNSNHYYSHKIEHGTRLLCGLNKKVTISFYAASSIANKRIAVSLLQNYGTGGSPTSQEPIITSAPITLTSTLTKYTITFTTNTLVGKTFGTANDDYLQILIHHEWGTTFGNTYVYPSVTAETYVGSGNIDIAQVQLCAGDVALPFMPKSYEDELKSCLRYYKRVVPGTDSIYSRCIYTWTSDWFAYVFDSQLMRTTPTVSLYGSPNGTSGYAISGLAGGGNVAGFTFSFTASNGNGFIVKGSKTSHGLTDGIFIMYPTYGYELSAEL